MLVQGSPPPSDKEKSCIIKMGGEGRVRGVQEERDKQEIEGYLCMRREAEKQRGGPATHGFGLEEQNSETSPTSASDVPSIFRPARMLSIF